MNNKEKKIQNHNQKQKYTINKPQIVELKQYLLFEQIHEFDDATRPNAELQFTYRKKFLIRVKYFKCKKFLPKFVRLREVVK